MSSIRNKVLALTGEVKDIHDDAQRQGRSISQDEFDYCSQLLAQVDELRAKSLDGGWNRPNLPSLGVDVGRALGSPATFDSRGNPMFGPYDPGAAFVNSTGFKSVMRPEGRSQKWSTGLVQVTDGPPLAFKGTMSEGMTAAYGAGFVSVPQLVPGVVDVLSAPLSIERALNSRVADSPTVRYLQQGTATSGAAGVLEGGAKPESTLGIISVDETIKKVATWTSASDEILEDAPSVGRWINSQLATFINIEAERQLLRGSTTSEVKGLLSRSIPVYNGGTAAGDKAMQLFRGANSMRGSAFIEPDFFIVHSSDYETIRTLRDSNNQIYGGGPFFGQYGSGGVATAGGQITGATDTLWGKPCYVTASTALGAGTAIAGSRAAADIYNRGGLSVEMSNSATPGGVDYFTSDLVAIRAERRLGLCLYRTKGFVEIRLA